MVTALTTRQTDTSEFVRQITHLVTTHDDALKRADAFLEALKARALWANVGELQTSEVPHG